MRIEARSRLEWKIVDGTIMVIPIPADPIQAAQGLLKGSGVDTKALLAEREREREAEREGV